MPLLTIVVGANGAGKTTWCRANPTLLPHHFYDADSIAQGLGGYNDPKRQREARALVDRRIAEHLGRKESFGFESTYSGASRPEIVKRAHDGGYKIRAFFIGTHNAEINIVRVAARVMMRTGHSVPHPEIIRRWTACRENLLRTARQFNEIHLIDNSGGDPRFVAGIYGRKVERTHGDSPGWATSMIASVQERWTQPPPAKKPRPVI